MRWTGTTYGVGDGSTTFNLPDKAGRASVMKEAAASRLTATYFGGDSTALGAVGGSEKQTLTAAQIPSHQHNVYLKDPGHTHSYLVAGGNPVGGGGPFGFDQSAVSSKTTGSSTTGITIGSVNGTANDNQTASVGGGGAHASVQPTIVCNYIIRII